MFKQRLFTTLLLVLLLTLSLIACSDATEANPTDAPPEAASQFEADTTAATEEAVEPTTEPAVASEEEAAEPAEEMAETEDVEAAESEPIEITTPDEEDLVVDVDEEGITSVDKTTLDQTLATLGTDELTSDEVVGLLYMREEEKLAHDVYAAFYDMWGAQIFSNISDSELSHTAAVKTLLDRYQLPDPAEGAPEGAFTNSDLQELYNQLVATGSASLQAALEVGALIEELDISDLQHAIATTDNEDILLVYENLMLGSRNHLRAFVRTLDNQGGATYTPVYLDQETFDAIINSDTERGRGRRNGQN